MNTGVGSRQARACAATHAHRASLLHFIGDPFQNNQEQEKTCQYFEDGLLVVENGKISQVGPAAKLLRRLREGTRVLAHPKALIVPGFVDAHVHYPQTQIIASYGEHLLEWLNKYAFAAEGKFGDIRYAREAARVFLDLLLRHGTTTALVFATVHPQSAEALFEEARRLNLRLITGKVLMDRNAPKNLLDTPETAYRDSKRLIEKWHKNGRLLYAVTPRFAPACTTQQLKTARRLKEEFDDIYIHTHLSENLEEIAWVKRLFPWSADYFDVYERLGLTGRRSLFAHGLHLSNQQWRRIAKSRASVAFCPSSNLFLGSGLFDMDTSARFKVPVGIGSDIGAGTSFSLLQNLSDAYKICQLRGQRLSAFQGFYLATLGGATALGLEDKIGNFTPGKEADFVVLDLEPTALIAYRMKQAKSLAERLFVLMTLGNDRCVRETYVLGKPAYSKTVAHCG